MSESECNIETSSCLPSSTSTILASTNSATTTSTQLQSRRRKQAKPRAFKQLHITVSSSSSSDENTNELMMENKSGCELDESLDSSLSPLSSSSPQPTMHQTLDSISTPTQHTNSISTQQSQLSKVDHQHSHSQNEEEDNMIIMLPTDADQLEKERSEMATPCSPTETTASSETTSTSSMDEMQMTYTIGVTEGTPYPCNFCDKAFPRLSYLKRHEQIHSDQMPFRCDYCQRLFKHKRSRDRHVKLHTGDKRYRCCHCESAFSRSDHLKIHMKTHDHMKPFQCTICNRGYNTAAALTSHMQNHKRNNITSSITNSGNNNSNGTNTNTNVNNISASNTNKSSINSLTKTNNTNLNLTANASKHQESHTSRESPNKDIIKTEDSKANIKLNGCSSKSDEEISPTHKEKKRDREQDELSLSHHEQILQQQQQQHEQQQFTCGFCGVKCISLETHIREAHLHHLLFAGLFQNSFYHPGIPAALSNWQALLPSMPPPGPAPLALTTNANDILHFSNGVSSSPPPVKKQAKSVISSNTSSPIPRQVASPIIPQTPFGFLPLLCNQCSPPPSFQDFESFRVHLKSHLLSSHSVFPVSYNSHHCPYCNETITSDFESHLMNCHLGSVNVQYECQCCKKMFTNPDELQKHLMDIHAHHLYQCSLCRELFDSKVTIQIHFAMKHSNECKIYKCNICGEFWKNEHDFKLHGKLVHFQHGLHETNHNLKVK